MMEPKVEVEYTRPDGINIRSVVPSGYDAARTFSRNLSGKNRGMTVTILVNGIPVAEYLDGVYKAV